MIGKQTKGCIGMLARKAMAVVSNACDVVVSSVKRSWAWGLGLFGLGMGSVAQAALTVDPSDLYTGVESGFDAAALIGVAVAAVLWVVRFVKKGLRTA